MTFFPNFSPQYVRQSQAFANNFLSNINASVAQGQDTIACPVGLLMLLSTLLGSGAPEGRTAQEISKALELGNVRSGDEAYEGATKLYQDVFEALKHETGKSGNESIYNVPMASAMAVDDDLKINADFQNSLTQNFDTSLYQTNFKSPFQTMKVLNEWAYEKSYGRIPYLFTNPQEISRDTKLMLLNIFAFKDNWRATFPDSKPGLFFVKPWQPKPMPMMTMRESLPYVKDEEYGFSAIKKPMINDRFSFLVVLPDNPTDFKAIDHVLYDTKSIKKLFKQGSQSEMIKLTLPKFHLELKVDLIPTVKKMGIKSLFNPRSADLSGITKRAKLFVNLLEQASVLKVDESGVEAATATYASAVATSLFDPIEFKVDRPFGCMIYDEQLDLPLLVAKVVKPNAPKSGA